MPILQPVTEFRPWQAARTLAFAILQETKWSADGTSCLLMIRDQ